MIVGGGHLEVTKGGGGASAGKEETREGNKRVGGVKEEVKGHKEKKGVD